MWGNGQGGHGSGGHFGGVIVDQGADSMISMERLRIDQALSGHVVNNPHINI